MRHFAAAFRFIQERRLVFPGILIICNVVSAAHRLTAGDWKRGVYFLSSALCLLMVAL